jgi:hypothetical protein
MLCGAQKQEEALGTDGRWPPLQVGCAGYFRNGRSPRGLAQAA